MLIIQQQPWVFSSGEKQASSQLASEFKITQNTGKQLKPGTPIPIFR